MGEMPQLSDVQDASASPIPRLSVPTTTAPGVRGPSGVAPRQQFTRVNSGVPDVADAGAQAQKSLQPTAPGMKTASEVPMNIAVRPTLQQLMQKAAMDGTASAASQRIEDEARRQVGDLEGIKQASATYTETIAHARKLASAVEYIAKQASDIGPGIGPGALPVSAIAGSGTMNTNFGESRANQHPAPTLQPMQPGEAPTHMKVTATGLKDRLLGLFSKKASIRDSWKREFSDEYLYSPEAEKDYRRNSGISMGALSGTLGAAAGARLGIGAAHDPRTTLLYGAGGALAGGAAGGALGYLGGSALGNVNLQQIRGIRDAEQANALALMKAYRAGASVPVAATPEEMPKAASLVRQRMSKLAEDAINPAHISSGKYSPLATSVAGQSGPAAQDKDVVPGTYEGVAALTRRAAKANMRADMNQYIDEPMQTASTDRTLQSAFSHTSEAGAKIASVDPSRVAASRAMIAKLAEAGSR